MRLPEKRNSNSHGARPVHYSHLDEYVVLVYAGNSQVFNLNTLPGVELRANLKTICHKCHLFEVAFVWELTERTNHLPLGCLQGSLWDEIPLPGTLPVRRSRPRFYRK